MNNDTITQTVLFDDLVGKPLVATFDQAEASSDGGAVLLRAADQRLHLTRRLARCLTDARDPERVTHALGDLVAQRVFGIACGYPDANDSDRLADDPIQKLLLDRIRCTGRPWPPSRPCPGLRTAWDRGPSTRWAASWRRA